MEATKEQIKTWKEQFGEVSLLTIGDKKCYLKRPSRKALGFASVAGKDNPMKFNEVILNDCWIAGDEEIKTDDTLFLSACAKVAELVEIKEAELKKL